MTLKRLLKVSIKYIKFIIQMFIIKRLSRFSYLFVLAITGMENFYEKKLISLVLILTMILTCFGSVSAVCPWCGGPSIDTCTGIQNYYDGHWGCTGFPLGTAYYYYTWVECMYDSSHSIYSSHLCYCDKCGYSDCPGAKRLNLLCLY